MSKVIKMFYELKDANTGDLLESNMGKSEIAFVTGKNQVLEAIENAVFNMKEGEKTKLSLKAEEALGNYDENAIQTLPKEQFAGVEMEVGSILFGEGEDGSTVQVIVKEITDKDVTIDYNHPYAGKDLDFSIEITENREADADEEETGVVAMPHACSCGHDHCGEDHHEHGSCCGHDHEGGHCNKPNPFE